MKSSKIEVYCFTPKFALKMGPKPIFVAARPGRISRFTCTVAEATEWR